MRDTLRRQNLIFTPSTIHFPEKHVLDIPPPKAANPGSTLPHEPSPFKGVITENYKTSTPDWPKPVRPSADAPHIIVIMCDDLGFGHLSCYGGSIEAPNIAALAAGGLRYNNFHTTALCSPTRAALLTGRNHHSVGFSAVTELAKGYPGQNAYLPKSAGCVAEVLRQNGYSTYISGKWHLTPSSEVTAAGPFDRWPLGLGFERFFGFLPGETDHWHPMLTEDNHRIATPEREDYHLSEDIIEHAIGMLKDQRQIASDRPVFLYVPFGAPHCPFHAPEDYMARYRGKFDRGWDVLRQETFEKQKQLGIIPPDCDLPPRNPDVRPWTDLSEDERRLYARLMESFAGMVEHVDTQVGRLVGALRELEMFDDTLIMFLSDNGASQEGGQNGTTNTERFRNLMPMSVEEMLPDLDKIGGPESDPHYPTGWAMAGNTPFRRYKRDTHRGGNTDPLIVHWPARIKDGGAIGSHYVHVTDIYPTLLEVAGLPVPERINGVDQMPLEGHSLASTFLDADAPQTRAVQYYEMLGSRAIWMDGWTAVTWHKPGTDWEDDVWELYHQDIDFSQAHDLSAQEPERLKSMIAQWWEEARKHNVLPLIDIFGHFTPDPEAPRAAIIQDKYRYFAGTSPVPNQALPAFVGRAHKFTAHLTLTSADDEGILVAQGGNLGGWALYIRAGRLVYVSNFLKISTASISTEPVLPVGVEFSVTCQWEPLDGGGAKVQLLLNDVVVCEIPHMDFAPRGPTTVQEGLQIGRAWGPSVSSSHYTGAYAFSGNLRVVELEVDPKR